MTAVGTGLFVGDGFAGASETAGFGLKVAGAAAAVDDPPQAARAIRSAAAAHHCATPRFPAMALFIVLA